MSREEIRRHFDEIVAFADVERFLDTAAKHYSSGMYLRLAFAVAAHLRSEILLLDEVLAVGDADFQKKCLGVVEGIAGSGRTVLFVSHNLGVVESLCTRAILLQSGRIAADGPSREVVARYLSQAPTTTTALSERVDRLGDGRLRFHRIELLSAEGPRTGSALRLRLHYRLAPGAAPLRNVSFAVNVNHLGGGYILAFFSEETQENFDRIERDGFVDCAVPYLPLCGGSYSLTLYAAANGILADNIGNAEVLTVSDGDYFHGGARHPQHPPVVVAHRWSGP
jgi:lipopolysaccharide transport system ATP-binding protein